MFYNYCRDNGVKAIENLMTKRGKFDYILLETTGLADPGKFYISVLTAHCNSYSFRTEIINRDYVERKVPKYG